MGELPGGVRRSGRARVFRAGTGSRIGRHGRGILSRNDSAQLRRFSLATRRARLATARDRRGVTVAFVSNVKVEVPVVHRRSSSGLLTANSIALAMPGLGGAQDTLRRPACRARAWPIYRRIGPRPSTRPRRVDCLQPLNEPVPMVVTADIVRPNSWNLR